MICIFPGTLLVIVRSFPVFVSVAREARVRAAYFRAYNYSLPRIRVLFARVWRVLCHPTSRLPQVPMVSDNFFLLIYINQYYGIIYNCREVHRVLIRVYLLGVRNARIISSSIR